MKKLRVLSIDGGGIKGIIPAIICEYLEKEISSKVNKNVFLHEYFDFIVGTSTGGILGALYTSPKYHTANEIISLYKTLGRKIFIKSFTRKLTSFGGIIRPKYSSKSLENLSYELFQDYHLGDTLKPFMTTSYDLIRAKEIFFDSINAQKKPFKNFKLKDVVVATSSAPVYFNAKKLVSENGHIYNCIDGGIFANNPALIAYAEARNINFKKIINENKPSYPDSEDIILISLGTGKKDGDRSYEHLKSKGGAKWVVPIIDILFSTQSNTDDFILRKIFDSSKNKWNYYRLNPHLFSASIEMDNSSSKNIENLCLDAENFILRNKDKLDDIVQQLILNH
ncbi:patatin-like phospholipase family protein [uncultured Cetobacterium sp.]|uniref:patatin-like phospholipase family protein n=1 Tax=uncultured Cetobacterium sp. TaxID=527638 RepID=UPI002636AEF3|nr:patatin-like phospholipase family protein [uncultured Cetobacterium sp.]